MFSYSSWLAKFWKAVWLGTPRSSSQFLWHVTSLSSFITKFLDPRSWGSYWAEKHSILASDGCVCCESELNADQWNWVWTRIMHLVEKPWATRHTIRILSLPQLRKLWETLWHLFFLDLASSSTLTEPSFTQMPFPSRSTRSLKPNAVRICEASTSSLSHFLRFPHGCLLPFLGLASFAYTTLLRFPAGLQVVFLSFEPWTSEEWLCNKLGQT